jgi:hypothetical protein
MQSRSHSPPAPFAFMQSRSHSPPAPFAFMQSRSHSSIRLKQTKDTRAVEVKTVEDDNDKKYEIITVKAYFV